MEELKLAIAGEFRSGKTTLAEYAESHYNMTPFAFGDELKKGFHYHYPHIPRDPKPRSGYQLYGQLMRFVYGDDYWLNITMDEVERMRQAAYGYNGGQSFAPLITDVRQPNEFERLRKEGYKIVKVVAPYDLRKERARAAGDNFTDEDMKFETGLKTDLLGMDYLIINNGTLEELYTQLDWVMEDIRGYRRV